MRAKINILLFILLAGCVAVSRAGNPVAYLNFATYNTPRGQTYFETYLSVLGSSLKFVKNENGKYGAKAHVTLSFKRKDSVVASANFNVISPEINDSIRKPNFVEVHRFWLPKGEYTLSFTLDDPNGTSGNGISGKQTVHVGYPRDSICVSDAEFLQSYSPSAKQGPYNKCGYDMVPYVISDYSAQAKKLSFYCELYNTLKATGANGKIMIEYSIETPDAFYLDLPGNFNKTVTMDADTVVSFLAEVPIDKLPTGRYDIQVKVMDKNMHLLAQRNFEFDKDNPGIKSTHIPSGFEVYMKTRDTLEESVKCLAPISNISESPYVISDSLDFVPMPELRRFFYYFWKSRDSINPLEAWQKYLDKVMAVDNSFNVPGLKGYRTDRGRVYLQYGPPSHRIVENSNPSTYPHEIWQYYRLADGQTDVKFVFYTTAIETNNYILLHSTATGEVQDPYWQNALYSGFGKNRLLSNNIDQTNVPDELGEDLNDEFNNPH